MWDQLATEASRFFTYWNLLFLLQAALTTVALSLTGCVFGTVVGLVLSTLRLTQQRGLLPFRFLAVLFIEVFRRVPFLVTLMLVFFAFQLSGLELPLFVIAAISVFLIATAFLSEIIRGGFLAVHPNQWDAAATMNFNLLQTIHYVILPQAWRIILPPAFSFFLLFIKDTALASQIGVVELTYAGKVLNNRGFSPEMAFGSILILYFIISYPLSRFGAFLEVRLVPTRNSRT